jgi:hypothetical protein
MQPLSTLNLVIAAFVVTGPMTHVLELPGSMRLDGALWLAVQQELYRGWGALFGPVDILALLTTIVLAFLRRGTARRFRLTVAAAVTYGLMIAAFFVFVAPVNRAVVGWTAATLPPDWESYRLQWEGGYLIAAVLSIIALLFIGAAWFRERTVP